MKTKKPHQRKKTSRPVSQPSEVIKTQPSPIGARNPGLPVRCDSMKQVEAVYGIPIELMKYAKSQGATGIFSENNRVYVIPLLKWCQPTLRRLFAGGELRDGISEYLDPDQELARLRKEQADAAARENALANAELHTRTELEELLWENGLGVIRSEYFAMLKKYRQQPTPSVAEQIVRDDLPKLFEKVRSIMETKLAENAE